MNNGGPAFPELISIDAEARQPAGGEARHYVDTTSGMSLRDWFAGMALNGLLARGRDFGSGLPYELADEMLRERDK